MMAARALRQRSLPPDLAYLRLARTHHLLRPVPLPGDRLRRAGRGITIDIDLGWPLGHVRITISVHLHAEVLLEGPEFHA